MKNSEGFPFAALLSALPLVVAYPTRRHRREGRLRTPRVSLGRTQVRGRSVVRKAVESDQAPDRLAEGAGAPCILCTGGAGYIGSHTLLALRQSGYRVVALDNLSRASAGSVRRVRRLLGEDDNDGLQLLVVDLLDKASLDRVFKEHRIDAVIHFAAFKAVKESVEKPLLYYHNNVAGSMNLLHSMQEHGVKTIVFSSSCTVYSPDSTDGTFSESSVLDPVQAYGRSKLWVEQALEDTSRSDPGWTCCALRYFNPAGAHFSGELGEAPSGVVTNLVPFAQRVALGQEKELKIYGDDYPTEDGTAVRDYVHVEDIAEGHVAALKWLLSGAGRHEPFSVFNLGTGHGSSVLDVVKAFEDAGAPLRYRREGRRAGDARLGKAVADPRKAKEVLGWEASRSLDDIVESALYFQKCNPNGFEDGDLVEPPSQTGDLGEIALPDDLLSATPGHLRSLAALMRPHLVRDALRTHLRAVDSRSSGQGAEALPAPVAFGIDLGGSTLRVVRGELEAFGQPHDLNITERCEMTVPAELKSSRASAEDLFDFIAVALDSIRTRSQVRLEHTPLVIGLAFSFPMDHIAADRAVLKKWTKGWATRGVVGNDVGQLLVEALRRRNVSVDRLAIVNDCVGTLLAAPEPAQLSVVIGTGTNACFVDPVTQEVMNTEWGHLRLLREAAEHDGVTLEELMACRNLPRAAHALLGKAGPDSGVAEEYLDIPQPGCMQQLLAVLEDRSLDAAVPCSPALRHACGRVVDRSAALCAAGLASLLTVTRRPLGRPVLVALDGALIHEHKQFLSSVRRHLAGLLCPSPHSPIEPVPVRDAAAKGAMVAAFRSLD